MSKNLAWSIGKEGTQKTRLDFPPYRVFIYWFEENIIEKAIDVDRVELVDYIQNAPLSVNETEQLKLALVALDSANGITL